MEFYEHFEIWDVGNGHYDESSIAPYNDATYGTHHTFMSTGGWGGGGCAKFVPPLITENSYSGLWGPLGADAQRVNLRFLFNIGSDWDEGGGIKWFQCYNNAAEAKRMILWFYKRTDKLCISVSHEIDDFYHSWGELGEEFSPADYRNQWICLEYQVNLSDGYARIYITTQNGTFDEDEIVNCRCPIPSSYSSGLQISNFTTPYFQEESRDASNTSAEWIMYDEMRCSTAGYIGPPPGFAGARKTLGTQSTYLSKVLGVSIGSLGKFIGTNY